MHVPFNILLIIGVAALIGIIVSVLGMVGLMPIGETHPGRAEQYDDPFLKSFLLSIIILILDGCAGAIVLVWKHDSTHILAPGMAVALLLAIIEWAHHLSGAGTSWWSKLKPAPAAVPVKKPWLSKTILINTLVTLLLLAEDKLSFLQGVLPASKYQIAAFALPALNMLLRVYTTQGLSLKIATPPGEAAQ